MFLHQVLVQNQDPVADAVLNFDLPSNPLSVILIALRPLNDTGTLGTFIPALEIYDALNRITVRHRGESIISMTGRDAAVLAYQRHGIVMSQAAHAETTNDRRCVILPIFLGSSPYNMKSCFPQSRSGELTLELDVDVASAGYDDLQLTVETVELLGAKPKEYERKVQLVRTLTATGIADIDLPIGNLFRGALLFGTTPFTGAAPAPSWGRISTIIDGVGIGYSSTDFEVLHAMNCLRGVNPPRMDEAAILVDATQADAFERSNTGPLAVGSGGWQNYAYLDFDPLRDDEHSIDSARVSRFQIRLEAEATDLVRVVPIERIKV